MPPSFPIPPEQKLIRTFTGKAEQPIRAVWMRAANAARAAISMEGLEAFLSGARTASLGELRAVAHIDTMIGILDVDLTPLLQRLIFRSASAGEAVFAEVMGFPPLDVARFRREAERAARTMVGDLIQGIEAGRVNPVTGIRSRGSLEIVRDLVGEGFELGRSHRASAHLIRDVIGLDDRRSKALARYTAELEAQGVPEAKRLRMVAAESKRKLQSRGLAVSRTESVRAASIAQDVIWERGLAEGQMADIWEQEWVASPNAFNPEKCPSGICKALHHARAPIGGEFRPGISVPPIHPHCGCGRRLRRRDGASRTEADVQAEAQATALRKAMADSDDITGATRPFYAELLEDEAAIEARWKAVNSLPWSREREAERARISREWEEILDQRKNLLADDRRKLHHLVEVGRPVNDLRYSGDDRNASEATRWIERHLAHQVKKDVSFRTVTTGRSGFYPGTRLVELDQYATPGTGVHELGHWVEENVPGLKAAALKARDARTVGEEAVSLRDLPGGSGYGASEMAKADKFYNPYTGKIYANGTTEMTAMALEAFYRDPATLLATDRATYEYALTVLLGYLP